MLMHDSYIVYIIFNNNFMHTFYFEKGDLDV